MQKAKICQQDTLALVPLVRWSIWVANFSILLLGDLVTLWRNAKNSFCLEEKAQLILRIAIGWVGKCEYNRDHILCNLSTYTLSIPINIQQSRNYPPPQKRRYKKIYSFKTLAIIEEFFYYFPPRTHLNKWYSTSTSPHNRSCSSSSVKHCNNNKYEASEIIEYPFRSRETDFLLLFQIIPHFTFCLFVP